MIYSGIKEYIEKVLLPTKEQNDFLNHKIKSYKSLIEHNSKLSLKECRPAGSFNKNTMLKYKPELDLVLILNKDKKYHDFLDILHYIANLLVNNFPEIKIKKISKVSVQAFFTDQTGEKYDFDIVPSFWLNSPRQLFDVRNKTKYQGMTSIWNNEYIIQKSHEFEYFHYLTLLIKDWKDECGLKDFKSYY